MTTTLHRLSLADAGLELTREEFAEAEFTEPYRYERYQGKLVVMSPAGYEHHQGVKPFRNHLGAYELAHPDLVEDVFQESWTEIDEDSDREPDIAVYLRSSEAQPRIPERVPELVFEIVSAGWANRRRDYEEKRAEYEQIGVLEYVIVDRFDHCVTVLRLVDGEYVEHLLKPSDSYSTPLLPGLSIPLHDIIG